MSRVPLVEPLPPSLTAEDLFRTLPRARGLFFLDSATPAEGLGRWSVVGLDPYRVIGPNEPDSTGDLWIDFEAALPRGERATAGLPGPFFGGAVGFLSYDLGRRFERLPRIGEDDLRLPDLWFGLYDLFAVFEAGTGRGWLVSTGDPERGGAGGARAGERLRALKQRLPSGPSLIGGYRCGLPCSPYTKESYCAAVRFCLDRIAAGDVYQVNLSQRFVAPFDGDPMALYLRLRRTNPAPFAAYLDLGDRQILSSSPERFLRIDGGKIETRPIKGTRPRGADPDSDRRLAEELLASPKDRAELTMIVDLLRSDLGKVCSYGTVQTESIARLESYETVHHLVGVIRGRLRPRMRATDAIRACFPGGSITGAPKIAAMEIIERLEPTRRGVYCGSIGYVGFDGRADLNIAIRTALIQDGRIHVQVGGGIVADSIPEAEYEETLHKGEGIFRALGGDRSGESGNAMPATSVREG